MARSCPCGADLSGQSPLARYCSDRCRKRASRSPGWLARGSSRPRRKPRNWPQLEAATAAELRQMGAERSSAGLAVLKLARALDATGWCAPLSSVVALAKAHRLGLERIEQRHAEAVGRSGANVVPLRR